MITTETISHQELNYPNAHITLILIHIYNMITTETISHQELDHPNAILNLDLNPHLQCDHQ